MVKITLQSSHTLSKAKILEECSDGYLSFYTLGKIISDRKDIYLCGGSVLAQMSNKKYSGDFDLFCLHGAEEKLNEAFDKFFRELRQELLKEEDKDGLCVGDKIMIMRSNHAVTYIYGSLSFQVIAKPYEDAYELLNDFDLGICQVGRSMADDIQYYGNNFFQAYNTNSVRMLKRNVRTAVRAAKYYNRGYKLTPEELDYVISMIPEAKNAKKEQAEDYEVL